MAKRADHLATRFDVRAVIKKLEQRRCDPTHPAPGQSQSGLQPQLEVRSRADQNMLNLPLRWSETQAECGYADPVGNHEIIDSQPSQRGQCTQLGRQPQEQPRCFVALGLIARLGQYGNQRARGFGVSQPCP